MDDNILINKTKPVNNGLKRKRSQFTSPLQKAKTTLGNHLNPTPAESDDEEYSGSDGSKYNNEDETVSEDDLSNFPSKRRKVEVYAKIPVLVNDQLVLPKDISNKRFKCEVPGCGKSYKKPSRLREHERSHTGERPYICNSSGCGKSYLRESHLQAHSRTHLPSSLKPYPCSEPGCEKRFWTSTQLKVHGDIHSGAKPFACSVTDCPERFSKNHQLRSHITAAHSPPGTKIFLCEHSGCTKSFATTQKLKAHLKVHQADRYMCSDARCITSNNHHFQTWTALQAHLKSEHLPACNYPVCKGRTFASQKNLKAHLRTHEDHDLQDVLVKASGLDVNDGKKNNDIGRDWQCEWEDCPKAFKSKNAMTVHVNVTHLGQRNFACDQEGCDQKFGYKHLLQRHYAKIHGIHSDMEKSSDKASEDDVMDTATDEDAESSPFIEELTGARKRRQKLGGESQVGASSGHSTKPKKIIKCPWPHVFAEKGSITASKQHNCSAILNRAYDLRRHLLADHALSVEKEEVAAWVALNSKSN